MKRGEDERWLAAFFHFACFEKKRLIFSCVCDKMGKSSGTKAAEENTRGLMQNDFCEANMGRAALLYTANFFAGA